MLVCTHEHTHAHVQCTHTSHALVRHQTGCFASQGGRRGLYQLALVDDTDVSQSRGTTIPRQNSLFLPKHLNVARWDLGESAQAACDTQQLSCHRPAQATENATADVRDCIPHEPC